MTVSVQVVLLPHGQDLGLPAYQSEQAAGMDLLAAIKGDQPIDPMATVMIPCGFALALPPGYEAQVRPRSGLATRFGITLPNSPGTIDADYRGEVVVPLINLGSTTFTITRGMRIAQMVIAPVVQARWQPVRALPPSDRGTGGFGSTGIA